MAYACPVCDSLAPDGEHLAHHLAIVAMSRGGEHEVWLDEHAEGWRQESPETLASFAIERAEEVDHELADATAGERPDVGHTHGGGEHHAGGQHGHGHGAGHGHAESGGAGGHAPGSQTGASDEATADVLAEAREITQRMLADEEDGEEGSDGVGENDGEEPDRTEETDDGPAETDSDE